MRAILSIISAIILSINCVSAQLPVQRFEGELNVGFTSSLGNFHNGSHQIGADFGLELRYNHPLTAWDYGVALNVTTAVYGFSDHSESVDWSWDQSNRGINLMLVGDYNFRQGKKVNPFVGTGIGVSFYETVNDPVYSIDGTAFVWQPRVGVELFHHLRFSLFSTVSRNGLCNFGMTIGGVIGGRPKKH